MGTWRRPTLRRGCPGRRVTRTPPARGGSSEAHGIDVGVMRAAEGMARRAIGLGHATDGFTRIVEVLGRRRVWRPPGKPPGRACEGRPAG
ncbi:hypothetical protein [Micromonospora sp. KC213]|uniref:imine reductase family protein n=1 Tax=Micromonospora sp. KC213 TaxID=2530378 RepID=UPI003260D437